MLKIRRFIYTIILIVNSLLSYSQVQKISLNHYGTSTTSEYLNLKDGRTTSKSDIVNTNYDLYYYPTYNNKATILSSKGVKYILSNINYNIYQGNFDVEISKDSIYVLEFQNINTLTINGDVFKKYFNRNDHKFNIYQVIFENNEFSLLREDKVIRSNIRDPLNQSEPKIKLTRVLNYFTNNLKDNTDLVKVKLNKKFILSLVGDKNELVLNYIKTNNLSFKQEKDLKKILQYYDTL